MNRRTSILFGAVFAFTVTLIIWGGRGEPQEVARWGWLPGTLLGVVGGLYGALAGTLAPRGRGRRAVLTCHVLLLSASVGMLLGGLLLLLTGRAWHVWYPWLLPGVIGSWVFGALLAAVRQRYQEAEMRRLEAEDISSQ